MHTTVGFHRENLDLCVKRINLNIFPKLFEFRMTESRSMAESLRFMDIYLLDLIEASKGFLKTFCTIVNVS